MKVRNLVLAAMGSSALLISAAQAADSVFDGVYFGGKVTSETSKYKAGNIDGYGSAGFGAGLFGGYRTMMDSVCVGGEASIRYAGDKLKLGTTETKRSYVAGAHVLVGGLINPQALAGVKLGVEYAPYKVTGVADKKKTAFNVGGFTDIHAADSLCVRAEIGYTPSVSFTDTDTKASHQSWGLGLVYKVN